MSKYVRAKDGDYADALRKKYGVALFVLESTGAFAPRSVHLLKALSKQAKKPGARDGTIYGRNRSATRSFFVHHISGIAAAAAAYRPKRAHEA